jgi:hypothetical protein
MKINIRNGALHLNRLVFLVILESIIKTKRLLEEAHLLKLFLVRI